MHISDEAIIAAAQLGDRYITDRFLPDKAIDLLDEAAAEVRLRSTVPPVDVRRMEEEIASLEREKEDAVRAEDYEKAADLKQRQEQLKTELEQRRRAGPGAARPTPPRLRARTSPASWKSGPASQPPTSSRKRPSGS